MNILNLSDEEKILAARAKDCIGRCNTRGTAEFTDFLSDRERAIVLDVAAKCGVSESTVAFGGYTDAERCIVGFFPEYSVYLEKDELIREFPVSVLGIQCSGFREHTHRDFLGSVLGLGLERTVIGDIIVGEKGYSAVMFVHSRISGFLCENLNFIGRDGVKVSVQDTSFAENIKKEFETLQGTCASLRLDAVISEVLNLSREKSQRLICEGLVTVNHEVTSDKDKSRLLELSDIFTVRGFGKFRLSLIGDKNRKGRTRFEIQKYI